MDFNKGGGGGEEVGLEYWVRWQVPVCALIFILPTVVAVRLLKRVQSQPLKSTDLWLPCWRNLNPLWLLFFRVFAFASMAFLLYHIVLVLGGAFAFYFYTQLPLPRPTYGSTHESGNVQYSHYMDQEQSKTRPSISWNPKYNATNQTVPVELAIVISARGCWMYSKKKKSLPEDRESDEFLKKNSEAKETKGTIKFQSRHSQEEIECKTGFLEHLVQAIYQTCAGAVMLTDIVFWCLLVPFLLGDKFQLTLLIGCIHSVNAVFLILDSALNSQPFSWYGLAYFVLWSVSYVVFQWILHACGFTWWPYPFLDLSTPWAPLWTVNTTSRNSLEKKQA
ncbi:hypothetical protein TEA_001495 [Camellia sinensis var. sinensis]|uniref:Uncharacterized protein n=1 Tax=Camellia sinensis var. sinensis TaxID=542762 RepID=A0A4S4E8A4_CAMSN|nr:hypothetical protein TEA_001495 [Camellia sinensis var. sinensis]